MGDRAGAAGKRGFVLLTGSEGNSNPFTSALSKTTIRRTLRQMRLIAKIHTQPLHSHPAYPVRSSARLQCVREKNYDYISYIVYGILCTELATHAGKGLTVYAAPLYTVLPLPHTTSADTKLRHF